MLTELQKKKIVSMTRAGKTTGQIIEVLGPTVSESQVAYIKRTMTPCRSKVISVRIAPALFYEATVIIKAVLSDGKEVTVGLKGGYDSLWSAALDCPRFTKVVSRELIGKEIEYSVRRAPRGTLAAKRGKLYYTVKFQFLPERLKKEIRGR